MKIGTFWSSLSNLLSRLRRRTVLPDDTFKLRTNLRDDTFNGSEKVNEKPGDGEADDRDDKADLSGGLL
jgi:hypothetical protein